MSVHTQAPDRVESPGHVGTGRSLPRAAGQQDAHQWGGDGGDRQWSGNTNGPGRTETRQISVSGRDGQTDEGQRPRRAVVDVTGPKEREQAPGTPWKGTEAAELRKLRTKE